MALHSPVGVWCRREIVAWGCLLLWGAPALAARKPTCQAGLGKLRPYFALDIEGTGADPDRAQVLQISMVYDDGVTPEEELPTLDILVRHPRITYGEPVAMDMNGWILEAIENDDPRYRILDVGDAMKEVNRFVAKWSGARPGRLKAKSVTIAGKNAGGYDIPVLRHNGFNVVPFHHRVIDPGSMFVPYFGYVPNLTEVNTLLGRKPVSHHALDDARDVVHAVREGMKGAAVPKANRRGKARASAKARHR